MNFLTDIKLFLLEMWDIARNKPQQPVGCCGGGEFCPCSSEGVDSLVEAPLEFISDDEVRTRAYYIWEQAGKPEDQSDANWAEAEQELLEENLAGSLTLKYVDVR